MGRVSKCILNRINCELKQQLDVVLWKKSTAVIDLFRSIQDKGDCTFVTFDVVEFYPSISKGLLHKALDFAK